MGPAFSSMTEKADGNSIAGPADKASTRSYMLRNGMNMAITLTLLLVRLHSTSAHVYWVEMTASVCHFSLFHQATHGAFCAAAVSDL